MMFYQEIFVLLGCPLNQVSNAPTPELNSIGKLVSHLAPVSLKLILGLIPLLICHLSLGKLPMVCNFNTKPSTKIQ